MPGQKRNEDSSVIAFTSAVSGEGVTYVTQSFGVELAKRTRRPTIIADIETLQRVDLFDYTRLPMHCRKTDVPYLHVLEYDDDQLSEPRDPSMALVSLTAGNELDQGVSNLQTLKYSYDYILVDCPSMQESGDAAFFASAVDGVVLVVEAENTRKEQVRSALSTIEMADANVLGCVLNKRRYPIPGWLYRRV
jgi:protein-tyrosine kinase